MENRLPYTLQAEMDLLHNGEENSYAHSFDGVTIHIPHRYKDSGNELQQLPEEKSWELACKVNSLRVSVEQYLGEGELSYGGAIGGNIPFRMEALTKVNSNKLFLEASLLKNRIKEAGHDIKWMTGSQFRSSSKPVERWGYYLDQAAKPPSLFHIDLITGGATCFPNRTSPLRVGAERVHKELTTQFDVSIMKSPSQAYSWGEKTLPTETFIRVLSETRAYAEELLQSVGTATSPGNMTNLLNLLHMKSHAEVKNALTVMPFLKVNRSVDKNLATLAGEGITYENLLLLYVSQRYPKTFEELKTLFSMPEEWLFTYQF